MDSKPLEVYKKMKLHDDAHSSATNLSRVPEHIQETLLLHMLGIEQRISNPLACNTVMIDIVMTVDMYTHTHVHAYRQTDRHCNANL